MRAIDILVPFTSMTFTPRSVRGPPTSGFAQIVGSSALHKPGIDPLVGGKDDRSRCPHTTGTVRLDKCFLSMRRMWWGLVRTAGGGIDQEQPERSWNEFVLRRERDGLPNPLLWCAGGRLAVASSRAADGVTVLHASGSGDDTLLAVTANAAGQVTLVSADRALCQRAEALGADVAGPGWLIDLLGK